MEHAFYPLSDPCSFADFGRKFNRFLEEKPRAIRCHSDAFGGRQLPMSSQHHLPEDDQTHFNGLTPAEAELLALLSEECGELVQAIGKVLRHGLESRHPDGGDTNRVSLCWEMGDVRAAMILLCKAGVVKKRDVHDFADDKLERVSQYLHHAEVTG